MFIEHMHSDQIHIGTSVRAFNLITIVLSTKKSKDKDNRYATVWGA